MGKKSRKSNKKHQRKGAGAAASPTAADDAPPPPSPEAVCWICLDGGLDEGGEPLVRDCACRGGDAGFAHVSCLASYAEVKCKARIDESGGMNFVDLWCKCPNCRQRFQRQLGIDMAKRYMSFVEENAAELDASELDMKLWKLDGLKYMIDTMENMEQNAALREEGKRAAKQMISEIEELVDVATKEEHGDDIVNHIKALRKWAIEALGIFQLDGTQEGDELYLLCQEKLKNYYISEGDDMGAKEVEAKIKMTMAELEGRVDLSAAEEALMHARRCYEKFAKEQGKDAARADVRIGRGIYLARCLSSAGRGVERQRLLTDLDVLSRRVLGPDHAHTKEIKSALERSRQRPVKFTVPTGSTQLNIVGYNNYNNKEGWYDFDAEPWRNITTRGIYRIRLEHIEMSQGTPVMCHGLTKATHLNGKIGDVMRYDADARHYEVRFEDASLDPACVGPANLRIVFDLPEKE